MMPTADTIQKIEAEEALRHSEQRFRALIENSKDVIVLSASDGKMVYLSPSIKDIFGYDPGELLGTMAFDIMHPEETENNLAELMRLIDSPGLSGNVTIRIKHKNGNWRWIEATSTSQLNNPAVNAIVSNFHDITERKEAEDKLAELNQSLEERINERTIQLQEANKALESFSYITAHDLQSPLRIVSGYASIIKDKYKETLGQEGMDLFSGILKETKHMSQLIRDLLDFSTASHTPLNKEKVDFDNMLPGIINECRLSQNTTKTNIQLSPLGTCVCDDALMRQVWTNLICNAVKYSSRKANPIIEIGYYDHDGEKVYYVKDNGVGFDMANAQKLFNAFQRLHTVGEFEGSGIGLAIVSNIILRHNGRIWAEAEVGKGATFFFTMP